jgi:hypothetical protein
VRRNKTSANEAGKFLMRKLIGCFAGGNECVLSMFRDVGARERLLRLFFRQFTALDASINLAAQFASCICTIAKRLLSCFWRIDSIVLLEPLDDRNCLWQAVAN